jgi:3-oxoacyl-[acyl-carrier protein] reductase
MEIGIMGDSVAVVTGGGRGIGRAICVRFATDGYQVVAASRSRRELEETRDVITRDGGRCHVHVTDVCAPDEIESLMEATVARFGRIDVLVNNAGVGPLSRIEDLEPSLFRTLMAVNVDAVYYGCRAVWPVMRRQGSGVIINMSSVASVDPFPGFTAYGAAKAWVNAWTRGLADEGREFGIRVSAVAPGAVETRMLRDAFPDFPVAQTLEPSDIADVVHALARPECRHVAGQTVFAKK